MVNGFEFKAVLRVDLPSGKNLAKAYSSRWEWDSSTLVQFTKH